MYTQRTGPREADTAALGHTVRIWASSFRHSPAGGIMGLVIPQGFHPLRVPGRYAVCHSGGAKQNCKGQPGVAL